MNSSASAIPLRVPTVERSWGIWRVLAGMIDVHTEWERVWFDLVGGDEFCEYLYAVADEENTSDILRWGTVSKGTKALLALRINDALGVIRSHVGWDKLDVSQQGLYFALLINGYAYSDVIKATGDVLERSFVLATRLPNSSWDEIQDFITLDVDLSLISSFKGLNNAL